MEKIVLPTATGEAILLLRCSLDESVRSTETDPPLPESFRVWVLASDGAWARQFRGRQEILSGDLAGRRAMGGRFEYGFRQYRRGSAPKLDLYTSRKGNLVRTETKYFPDVSEIDNKRNELGEGAYDQWYELASALPIGFDETYEEQREWATVAELVGNGIVKWRDGPPPEEPEELMDLRRKTGRISLQDLRLWLER